MKAPRYILIDRDGTVIAERNYLFSPDQIEMLPNAAPGLRLLQESGFQLILVTNQSGIARGFLTVETLEQIHDELRRRLASEDVHLAGIYFCPHLPEEHCECRKPQPSMALEAAGHFGFDLKHSYVIGDKPCDIDLGKNCGARTVLVRTGYGARHEAAGLEADIVADDLLDAARQIIIEIQ